MKKIVAGMLLVAIGILIGGQASKTPATLPVPDILDIPLATPEQLENANKFREKGNVTENFPQEVSKFIEHAEKQIDFERAHLLAQMSLIDVDQPYKREIEIDKGVERIERLKKRKTAFED